MKTTYLRLLCLFMASCLLFACKSKTTKATKTPTTVSGESSTPNTPQPRPKPAPNPTPPITEPTTPEPKPTPTTVVNKLCGDANFDLDKATNKIAKELSGIMYAVDPKAKADCSGIFHRVLGKFKNMCPDVKLPSFDNARDTRSLATWYNKNGHLKIIRNPETEADLIQPGAVMFYGYGKRRNHYNFQKMNMDTLTLRGTGINHIAIVTSVNRVDGELISYELFHGRSTGKESKVTKSQKVTSWDKTWPMYGNLNFNFNSF